MDIIIDTMTPPPAPSLMDHVRQLEPGQSLLTTKHSLTSLRSTSTRVKREFPGRKFKFAEEDGERRIWRIA